jgi:hypothetical protein
MRYIHNDEEYTQKTKNVVEKVECRQRKWRLRGYMKFQSEPGFEKGWIMEAMPLIARTKALYHHWLPVFERIC